MKTNKVPFLGMAVLAMIVLGFKLDHSLLATQEPEKTLPPLATRLAGTKWINTNKVTFDWDEKGRFFHNGKERKYQVVDDTRLRIVFSEKHVDTLVFDAQLTRFEQFSTREPNLRPLFTGKVVFRSETAETVERERREALAKAERDRQVTRAAEKEATEKAERERREAIARKEAAEKAEKDRIDAKAVYAGQITADDGVYVDNRLGRREKRSKFFTYQAEAGRTYRIDLASKDFDAYLYLLDYEGKVIAANDDNGESLDSRIMHKTEKAGTYTVVVTSLSGQSNGAFTLTVRPSSTLEIVKKVETQKAKPPTEITADYLPHKPGTVQHYDTEMPFPDGKAGVLRRKVTQQADGVIESTTVRIGSLNAGESIMKGDEIVWLRKTKITTSRFEAPLPRYSGGEGSRRIRQIGKLFFLFSLRT